MSTAGAPGSSPPQRQRLRGMSFKQEYANGGQSAQMSLFQRMKARVTQDKPVQRARQPSMVHDLGKMLVPPKAPEMEGKLTVVLDLDETLIYAREGPLYARPGLDDLMKLIKDNFEGIVWTAGVKAYAQAVVRNIDKHDAISHCVYRHKKWFTGCAGYNKDLTLLGRDMNKTLILENTPDCLRGNEENGILVADYEGGEYPDNTLPAILLLLTDLKQCMEKDNITVPQYIRQSRFLSKQRIPTDVGNVMTVYCLDINDAELFRAQKEVRVNKDLPVDQQRK